MTTIVQVAQLARVSTSTVSHVLNSTRHVEPETRQRVMDAIEQTGYRQDALARALRRSRTDSIGLVLSDAGEPAFADMAHGVGQAAADLGLTLLLANSAEGRTRELDAVHALLERRVDGLIIARAAESGSEVVDILERERTPVVLLDRVFPELSFDQVAAENAGPMKLLISHLVSAGHRRFCVIAGDLRVPSLRERREGFEAARSAFDLDPADQRVLVDSGDPAALRQQLLTVLAEADRPTAYIAASTVLAAHTLETFQHADVRTPRDVAFATFDGFSHPDLFEPRITTVRQQAFEVGTSAVRLLQDRMAGRPTSPRTLRLQQAIEYRESTEGFTLAR